MSVYPTLVPKNGSITAYGFEDGEAVIRSVSGKPVTQKQAIVKDAKNIIQIPDVASGVYYLELKFTRGGRHVIPIHIQ